MPLDHTPPRAVVRPATAADVDAICRICAEGFRLTARGLLDDAIVESQVAAYYTPERVRREIAPSGTFWLGYLVAEVDGVVVGAAGGGMADGSTGQLLVVYLDVDRRGEGIGTELLEAVTAQQVVRGAVRQRVSVLADNDLGVPFYRARGFVEVGRVGYPPSDPQVEELQMERPLPPWRGRHLRGS